MYAFADREKTNPISNPHRKSEFIPTRRQRAGNRTHHSPTAQATINMQNKPNFRKAKMNLTTYANKDYGKMCLREPRKNKPNFEPTTTCSVISRYSVSSSNITCQTHLLEVHKGQITRCNRQSTHYKAGRAARRKNVTFVTGRSPRASWRVPLRTVLCVSSATIWSKGRLRRRRKPSRIENTSKTKG
jgi:hypothetical protein